MLATALYGAREGFAVDAALVPQPRTDHVVEVVRAGLARGMRPHPAGGYAAVALAVAPSLVDPRAYFVMVGGSSVLGSSALPLNSSSSVIFHWPGGGPGMAKPMSSM